MTFIYLIFWTLMTAVLYLTKDIDSVGEPLKEHAIGECIMIIKDDAPTIIEAEESEG